MLVAIAAIDFMHGGRNADAELYAGVFLAPIGFDIDDAAPEAGDDVIEGDFIDRRFLTPGNEADEDLLADEAGVPLAESQAVDRYPATGAHRRSTKQERCRARTRFNPARNDRTVRLADPEYRDHKPFAQPGISKSAQIDPLRKNRHAGAIKPFDRTDDLARDIDRLGVAF